MFDCASSLPVVGIVTPLAVDPVLTGVFGTTTVPVDVDPRDVVAHEFVTPVEVDPVLTGVAQLLFQ